MVDFFRGHRQQLREQAFGKPSQVAAAPQHAQAPVEMTECRGGPCDGIKVLKPPPPHRGLRVCIGVPAPPDCGVSYNTQDGPLWCVYMWQPSRQQYHWLDFLQASQDRLAFILRQLTDSYGK